ncbi:hypothetical protein IJJ12_01310 [bacterium]|nr:hypothetical protein [bacterium]
MKTAEGVSEAELRAAREQGERLSEFMLAMEYFLRETPEGLAVRREMENDWQQAVATLRASKQLVGADFSLAEWLHQVQREFVSQARASNKSAKKETARKPGRPVGSVATRSKPLKFKNIP